MNYASATKVGGKTSTRQIGNATELVNFSGGYGASKVQYRLDRLDDPVIPRAGESFQGDFYWYNASPAAPKPYPVLEGEGEIFHKLNEPSSVFLAGYGWDHVQLHNRHP